MTIPNKLPHLLIIILIIFISSAAMAQGVLRQMLCGNHDMVVRNLENKYKETLVGIGVVTSNQFLELWVSRDDTRSFTLVLVKPGNIGCVLESGEGWEFLDLMLGSPT